MMYGVIIVDKVDIPTVRQQGALEVAWATDVEAMCLAFPAHAHRGGNALAIIFDNCVQAWPLTLLQRLEWGDLPHYGERGGSATGG